MRITHAKKKQPSLIIIMSAIENVEGQTLDIYPPTNANADATTLAPVIFYVHGGAWHVGNKSTSTDPCEPLARAGYLCVATSYSLSYLSNPQIEAAFTGITLIMLALALTCPTANQMMVVLVLYLIMLTFFVILWTFMPRGNVTHPDHIMDVAKNFKWTVENIHKYGGDPNRIYVAGHSAGGHLASLLSTNSAFLRAEGVEPDRIKGCISFSGVYSDKRLQETGLGKQFLKNAFGNRKQYYDAFPIYNISGESPPFLLVNSGMDISMKRHTLDFHYALRQAGVFVQTTYFEDLTHWNITKNWEGSNAHVMKTVTDFIAECQEHHQAAAARSKGARTAQETRTDGSPLSA